jgi:hypothetical protein
MKYYAKLMPSFMPLDFEWWSVYVEGDDRHVACFRSQAAAEEYAAWKNGPGRHPSTEVEDDYIDSPVQDSSRPPAILPPAGWQNQPIPQQQEPKAIKFREFL